VKPFSLPWQKRKCLISSIAQALIFLLYCIVNKQMGEEGGKGRGKLSAGFGGCFL